MGTPTLVHSSSIGSGIKTRFTSAAFENPDGLSKLLIYKDIEKFSTQAVVEYIQHARAYIMPEKTLRI